MDVKKVQTIKNKLFSLLLVCFLLSTMLSAKDPGYEAFIQGDYNKADTYYRQREEKVSKKHQAKLDYNSGTTAMALNDAERAKSRLVQSLSSQDDAQKAMAHYNLGQLAMQEKDSEAAMDHFRKSMIYDPDNINSKIMYENLLLKKEQEDQQKNNDQNGENNENGEDSQDKKSSQNDQNGDQQQDKNNSSQDQQDQNDQEQDDTAEKDQQPQDQEQGKESDDQSYTPVDMDKKQAENFLDPMKEKEKESMKKLILSKAKGKKVKRSKDW